MEHFLELFVNVVLKVGLPLIECSIKVIECRLKIIEAKKKSAAPSTKKSQRSSVRRRVPPFSNTLHLEYRHSGWNFNLFLLFLSTFIQFSDEIGLLAIILLSLSILAG